MRFLRLLPAVSLLFSIFSGPPPRTLANEPETKIWPNSAEGFEAFTRIVQENRYRNLLSRKGVMMFVDGKPASLTGLTDGEAGEPAGEGRVGIDGAPQRVAFYLGGRKPVRGIRVFTYNGDSRANQDYEVRFADNHEKPGQLPEFPGAPRLTTGDVILGADRGGCLTTFSQAGGGTLSPGEADWVEFRIWKTYPSRAGEPGKENTRAEGWCSVIEVQVFGNEDDVVMPSPEEIVRREALKNLPKDHPYEKQATWHETMRKTREAIVGWETGLDRVLSGDPEAARARFGEWRLLGPVPADAKCLSELDRARKIDWEAPLKMDETRSLKWQPCGKVKAGEMVDLARGIAAAPGQVIVLAHDLEILPGVDSRDPLVFGLGLGDGRASLLGTSNRLSGFESPAFPNQGLWEIKSGRGMYQAAYRLTVAADGTCRFWWTPQSNRVKPGAGDLKRRVSRRDELFRRLEKDFPDPVSQRQMDWERFDSVWTKIDKRPMAGRDRLVTDWDPARPGVLIEQYRTHAGKRLEQIGEELQTIEEPIAGRIRPWLSDLQNSAPPADLDAARRQYCTVATVQDIMALHHEVLSMRLAIRDQEKSFGDRYPRAAEFLTRVAALEKEIETVWPKLLSNAGSDATLGALLALRQKCESAESEILFANPVLDFEKLLLVGGGPGFASNWGGPCSLGDAIVTLSPPKPDGKIEEIYRLPSGRISNVDVDFDADRLLFSDSQNVWEVKSDGTGARQITKPADEHVHHYDPCFLPNEKICFVSTACEQAVPCTGQWYVGNLHLMDADGNNERRLTYDQDHNWNPAVLNDGRVLYTRWEYTDTPHYFTRLLFHMNPDGTGQKEYYGSNSYWPNAMFWTRPIPGHPSEVVTIVSGHHGVSRVGELVLLDPALGRHEADGVVQRIPGRGKKVEPVIMDGLVRDTWPRFAMPYPLADPDATAGAGKYFLVNMQPAEWEPWGLYLVDVFDNVTPLLTGGYSQPVPLRPRPRPPVIPAKVDLTEKQAVVYLADVYSGGGLKGYPRGSIRSLRVGSHHFRYGGNGDTSASSIQGGWDVKRILGTVPVNEDGSAMFHVPANTPIFLQPLDEEGKSQQVMRSWFSAMPGEVLSCVGCHESQNEAPPAQYVTMATRRAPDEIRPWGGPARGFSFDREVQPLLDRKCAGCHNGETRTAANGRETKIDFRAKRLHEGFDGPYSPAYKELQKYVRRAGFESDYHMHKPSEFEADTSPVVKILKKGHYNVTLTGEEWDRLYTWIDFNVPYPSNWLESHRPPEEDQVLRRASYKKGLAGLNDLDEQLAPLPPIAEFEAPKPLPAPPAGPPALDSFPFNAERAVKLQQAAGDVELVLDLGDGVTLPMSLIPSGQFVMGARDGFPDEMPASAVSIGQPYYMGRFEVTNRQYAQFDPDHDSGYVEGRGKDRIDRGVPINEPGLPVVRVSWNEAMAFCAWLTKKTGRIVTLPTEAQWEWACRAGTATEFSSGDYTRGMKAFANVADDSAASWNHDWAEPGYNDGMRFLGEGGRFAPNAWGLCDMHGNVAEWCLSLYRPYPYQAGDKRDAPAGGGHRVVRGGSWIETLPFAASASRWRYQPYQSAYSVGFRVVVTADPRQ